MKKQNFFEILVKTVLSMFLVLSTVTGISALEKENIIKAGKEEDKAAEVYVVEEAEELRDEYSETFLNSDGSFTLNMYATPIHYRNENGELVEIDASLTRIPESEKQRMSIPYEYRATSTEVDILLPETVSLEEPILVRYKEYSVKLSPISEEAVWTGRKNSTKMK